MKTASRINLIYASLFTIILFLSGVTVVNYTLTTFREEMFDDLLYSGQAMANHVRTYLNDQKKAGAILAAASVYRDFLKEAADSSQYTILKGKIDKRLQRTIQIDNNISEVFILDKNGTIVASSDRFQEGKNKSADLYFINGQKHVYIKDMYLSSTTNQIGYAVSAPIIDDANNTLLGVSVIRYTPDSLNKILNVYGLSYKTKEAFLINQNKYFLTPSRFRGDQVILKQTVNTVNARRCFDPVEVSYVTKNGYDGLDLMFGKSLHIESKDYRQIDVLASHNYIPETNWCLITKMDRSEFLIIPNRIKTIFITILIITLIIFIPTGSLLARWITRPLEKLSQGVLLIREGNLNYKVGTNSGDEIGHLSREFDKMTQSIKESRAQIDQKVHEQTKEIAQKAKAIENQQKAILNIMDDMETANNDLLKYKMAVDNASDHIVITDPDGIILYANQMVEDITGFDKNEIIGKKVGSKNLWGGTMPSAFYKNLWKTIKSNKQVFTGEINNHRKNGQTYTAIASISPVLNSRHEIIYFVGIERDVTHIKEVDRMKSEFVSFASHQLRTPLSAMRWFAEMLLAGDAGKLNREQTEFIKNIYDSNQRMTDLVRELLDISRIESGRIIIDPIPTDIVKLVKGIMVDVSIKAREKKQKIITSFNSNLPLINLDPNLIRNVYQNLINNAIKYTPEKGEITIFVSKKGGDILSQITDNGFGIPLEQQKQTFQKFFRASNAVKKETAGSGLGLYLVKAIIESSGGKIWFKSQENKGTTFWFSLPIIGIPPKKGQVRLGS